MVCLGVSMRKIRGVGFHTPCITKAGVNVFSALMGSMKLWAVCVLTRQKKLTKYGIGVAVLERLITDKQKNLIDQMNEFCREKFLYDNNTTCKAASDYISRNIEEFKLQTMSNWQLQYL